MDDQLPAYGSTQRCPKCTCVEITDSYRAQQPRLSWSHDERIESVADGVGSGECILRACQDCDFAWLERCADSDVSEPHLAP